MTYDVAEYSDYEYEKYVNGNGRSGPDDAYMDEKYGRGGWTDYHADDHGHPDHPANRGGAR